jgi:outer membrane protein assembly factor BamD (BamD/ComL family)
MKALVISLVVIFVVAAVFIGNGEMVSAKIETYAETKFQEPKIEEYALFNMKYMYWVAKYDRVLALIEKFEEKYSRSKNVEYVQFLRAKAFDKKLEARTAVRNYELYLENWPEGQYFEKAKDRVNDLKLSL